MDVQRYAGLLHGILISPFEPNAKPEPWAKTQDYARRRDDAAADRPRAAVRNEPDLEVVQEVQETRRRWKTRGQLRRGSPRI